MQISTVTLVNDYHGAIRGGSTVCFQSNVDGPIDLSLYLYADSMDCHLERAAEHFGVSVEALRAFRGTSVHGQSCVLPM